MTPVLTAFIDECRADPRLTASTADAIELSLEAVDREADENGDAMGLLDAISWISSHRDRSLLERFAALDRLLALEGRVVINMCSFTGWPA